MNDASGPGTEGIAARTPPAAATGAGSIPDTTGLRHIPERRKTQEERNRLLSDLMLQGVVHHDSAGRVIAVNPAAERILGRAASDLLGRASDQEDEQTVRADGRPFPGAEHPSFVALLTGREVRGVVMGIFHPQRQARRWIRIDAIPVVPQGQARATEVYAVFEDITDWREAEQELQRGQRLNEALNQISRILHATLDPEKIIERLVDEGVAVLGSDTGAVSLQTGDRWTVRYVNGLPPSLVGQQMTNDEERHAVLAVETRDVVPVSDAFQDPRFNREHLRRLDIRSVLVAPLIARDQPLGVIFFNYHHATRTFTESDLSFVRQLAANAAIALENARLFAEGRSAREAAEAANSSKDRFLAVLSHELRTPLTPVLMTASVLRGDTRIPADVREHMGMIERNVALEARLIDDLLDLTRIARGKLDLRVEPCELNALIRLVVEIVRDLAQEKRLSVTLALSAARTRVVADPTRLQQVFWNLLRNAIKFTPPGGTISVRSVDVGESRVLVEVADTGVGFDPADAERIFKQFEQSEAGHRLGGLGLGLAIARAVVNLHGGAIRGHSAGPGRGATFTVELPAGAAPPAGPPTPLPPAGSSASNPPAGKAARLLVVDDHASTLEVLDRLLTRAGYEVVVARTVAEARAAASARTFDLVISDLGLPDGTGHDLMEGLNRSYGLRGIALSGYGMDKDVKRSQEAGFAAHLVKPVNMNELQRVIRQLAAGVAPSAGP